MLFCGVFFSNHLAVPVPGVNIEEHLQLRQEEKRQRVIRRHRLEEGRGKMKLQRKSVLNSILLSYIETTE